MRRKRKNLIYLAAGLVIGFMVGALLFALNDDLRQDFFGTAADTDDNQNAIEIKPSKFYLIEYNDAEDWLAAIDDDNVEELGNDLEKIAGLADATDLSEYYTDTQDAIDRVLAMMHSALLLEDSDEVPDAFSACLALDNNPYQDNERGLFVYITVPSDLEVDIPEDWEELDSPHENNMLWTKECYSD